MPRIRTVKKPERANPRVHVEHADCIEFLATLAPDSVDAFVEDPPYGLGFMGKTWDHAVPGPEYFAAQLRVAKPGAHLVAFGGTRTYHRLTCAIEDAGWELRDCLMWMYGSGFPKSHNISKGIDKAAGAERKVVGRRTDGVGNTESSLHKREGFAASRDTEFDITAPATDAAKQWDGWGTNLKPAWEPIILARKPFKGSATANVLEYGPGALNIDGCRIAGIKGVPASPRRAAQGAAYGDLGNDPGTGTGWDADAGRWPANVILDPEAGAVLDAQTGVLRSGALPSSVGGPSRFFFNAHESDDEWVDRNQIPKPASTAERCFDLSNEHVASALSRAVTEGLPGGTVSNVCLAASTIATPSESRTIVETVIETILSTGPAFWHGQQLESITGKTGRARYAVARKQIGITTITVSHWRSGSCAAPATFSITHASAEAGGLDSRFRYCAKASKAEREAGLEDFNAHVVDDGRDTPNDTAYQRGKTERRNTHPTVKPIALMRWLVRLITPPGGLVCDPFCGSGTTGCAAVAEGFGFLGIEKDRESADIARVRVQRDLVSHLG